MRKKILVGVAVLLVAGFLNYFRYRAEVSMTEEQVRTESDRVTALLRADGYEITNFPYAVVEISDVNDIRNNQEFFSEAKKQDKLYYFESSASGEHLAVLYRPGTGSVIKTKKE